MIVDKYIYFGVDQTFLSLSISIITWVNTLELEQMSTCSTHYTRTKSLQKDLAALGTGTTGSTSAMLPYYILLRKWGIGANTPWNLGASPVMRIGIISVSKYVPSHFHLYSKVP